MGWFIGASCVGALFLGVWLGLPRARDHQSLEEIDQRLGEKKGSHRRVKRRITFLNLIQRTNEKGTDKRLRPKRRQPFRYR